jgi:predicted nucleic acid-binding protein
VTSAALLDNSAWSRFAARTLSQDRLSEIADAVASGLVHVCLPFLLEAGYSARNARDHGTLLDELLALPRVWITERVEERALQAQQRLARVGHHRLPPVDVLIAALADVHELDVLHYDADFDVIATLTDLDFGSVWLAPKGSL